MRRFAVFVLLIVAAVLLLQECGKRRDNLRRPERYSAAQGPKLDLTDVQVLAALDAEFTRLVETVVPSVVSINTARRVRVRQMVDPFEFFFGRRGSVIRERVESSLGSGVIVSKEGHILTNHHVVNGMDQILVQLHDGRSLPARTVGGDPSTDLAVLKVDGNGFEPLPFADSETVRVGQRVVAIGNPFGLEETVTQGIISAKGRRAIQDSAVEFFQTDATINPGNSGGPMVNLRGEIVGIATAIGDYSGTQTWQGVGFIIPSNTARAVMESLLKSGRVVRGYLGIAMQEITAPLARQFRLPDSRGALVAEVVAGSPAEAAGLRSGDVIRKLGGRTIRDLDELRRRIGESEPGTTVPIEIWRDGAPVRLEATIAEQPADHAPPLPRRSRGTDPANAASAFAGLRVSEIPDAHRPMLPADTRGVMVTAVEPGSRAAAVLRPGDVIERIEGYPITSTQDFLATIAKLDPASSVTVFLARGLDRLYAVIPAE